METDKKQEKIDQEVLEKLDKIEKQLKLMTKLLKKILEVLYSSNEALWKIEYWT